MPKQSVSRVLFFERVARFRNNDHSSSLAVADEIERPTRELERTTLNVPLFGLAPGGVYKASVVTGGAGELLPHLFTLTRFLAVFFLLHFPSRCRDWALPSALSCGARTFLSP